MILYCDNKFAINIAHNLAHHYQTKYVEVDRYFIKEKLDGGQVCMPYICTTNQLANVLTKGLPSLAFQWMTDKLGMQNIFAPTLGGVLEELQLGCWPCNIVSIYKCCIVVQYYRS